MKNNPYVGVRSYERQDGDRFYGREGEERDLLALIKAERAVLFYAQSGAGKTSLLNAKIVPRLTEQGFHVVGVTRVGSEAPPNLDAQAVQKANIFVLSALMGLAGPQVSAQTLLTHTLLSYLRELVPAAEDEEDRPPIPILILDQFEEILTTHQNRWQEAQGFFEQLREALHEMPALGVVLAMREDYIAGLDPYAALLPKGLRTRFRMELLSHAAALKAIQKPAEGVCPFDPEAAKQLVEDLSRIRVQQYGKAAETDVPGPVGPFVEPVALQVVCERLWENLPDDVQRIEAAQIRKFGDIDQALVEFYKEALEQAKTSGVNERELRKWFSEKLITPMRTRGLAWRGEHDTAGLPNAAVDILEKFHLIRGDVRAGSRWYELAHDRLVDPIRRSNREWEAARQTPLRTAAEQWQRTKSDGLLYRDDALTEARAWANANPGEVEPNEAAFLDASRRAQRDRTIRRLLYVGIALLSAVIIVVMAALTLYAFQQKGKAQTASTLAEQQRQIALVRQFAAQSNALISTDVDTSLLLSVEAYRRQSSDLDLSDGSSSLLSASQCCSDALVSFLRGHTDRVWDVAFSPDSRELASSGDDGSIMVWDLNTRTRITTLVNPNSSAPIYTVAFSPNGRILAAGEGDGSIILYDTQTWQPVAPPLHGHDFNVYSIKFAKDGSLLVSSGGDGKVIVWDVASRQPVQTFTGHTDWVWDVAISPDNRTVASVSRDSTLRLWSLAPGDAITNTLVLTNPGGQSILTSVAFNDDPQQPIMLTGDAGARRVRIWDMRPWQAKRDAPVASRRYVGLSGTVWGLAFVPGDNLSFFAGSGDGILRRYRIVVADDFPLSTVKPETLGVTGHNIGTFRIDISRDGKFVAAAGQDTLVSLWHAQATPNVFWHTAPVNSMRVLTGTVLASVDTSGNLFRWDYAQKKKLSQLPLLPVTPFSKSAISFDGTRVATGSDTGTVTLWDGQTGQMRAQQSEHASRIDSLAFSQDGHRLASGDEQGSVILWEVTSADRLEPSAPFSAMHGAIYALLFSPDGKTLVGGGCGYPISFPSPSCGQGAIYVWDTEPKLQPRYSLPDKSGFVWSMAFNPANPNELAVGTRDGAVTIWNLHDKTPRLTFRLGTSDINALAFSPDGKRLAVGIDSYQFSVYDAQTGQLFGQYFKEHDDSITALAFSPDGNSLFSASLDRTIVMHDMRPEDWLARACQFANRNLTQEEWKKYVGDEPYRKTCPDVP